MSKLLENKRSGLVGPVATNERCICKADNITIIPMYRTYDSLSYQISRCNYCREEWAEYWISYRYIVSANININIRTDSHAPRLWFRTFDYGSPNSQNVYLKTCRKVGTTNRICADMLAVTTFTLCRFATCSIILKFKHKKTFRN